MPAPPPPPPMVPAAPPQPLFNVSKGSGTERDALLISIRQGKKLKKTVTVDKSAPVIPGKVSSSTGNNNGVTSSSSAPNLPTNIPSNGLGALFAGGMPKLKPTGKLGSSTVNKTVNNNDVTPPPITPSKNFNNIQLELKKQLASDNRNRGPPPPAPNRNMSADANIQRQPFTVKENVSSSLNLSQLSLSANSSSLHANNSTLHRKTRSNANLTIDITDDSSNNSQPVRPVINHGKPNLAPKPPILNGKPTPPQKRNGKAVSRAHSMKSPRSPSPQSPDSMPVNKFGTVRHMSSIIISQSLTNSSGHNLRQRPALNARPSGPPPSIPVHQPPASPGQSQPPPPPPPSKVNVKHPNQAPPPPPPCMLPQAPSHAPPPPPPHKTQPVRPTPMVPPSSNGNPPPPPPPRHSSMRDTPTTKREYPDFDEKFKHLFGSPEKFPQPMQYKNVLKIYSHKPSLKKPAI